jgi:hypothetical protein
MSFAHSRSIPTRDRNLIVSRWVQAIDVKSVEYPHGIEFSTAHMAVNIRQGSPACDLWRQGAPVGIELEFEESKVPRRSIDAGLSIQISRFQSAHLARESGDY